MSNERCLHETNVRSHPCATRVFSALPLDPLPKFFEFREGKCIFAGQAESYLPRKTIHEYFTMTNPSSRGTFVNTCTALRLVHTCPGGQCQGCRCSWFKFVDGNLRGTCKPNTLGAVGRGGREPYPLGPHPCPSLPSPNARQDQLLRDLLIREFGEGECFRSEA